MTISEDLLYRAKNYSKQKSLGQNFLVDEDVLDDIVSAADLDPEDSYVLEIGPGIGFLTERLIPQVKQLVSVELDADTIPHLKILQANYQSFSFIRRDFLSMPYNQLIEQIPEYAGKKIKVVANIPYQITTKILLHLLGEIGEPCEYQKNISEINILVQKEFADRLVAQPGTKDYSAITHLIQYWAEVKRCIEVPKEAFRPIPKVDSSFIKLIIRDKPLVDCPKPKQLRRFIKAIFANRRKKLVNGLKAAGYQDHEIAKLNLPENLRGETLRLKEINEMVRALL